MTLIARRLLTLIFSFLFMLLTGGCWDHIPLERVAFAIAIGIDKPDTNPSAKEFATTISVAVPSQLNTSSLGESGGRGNGTPFYLISSVQKTLHGARSTALGHVPRRLQFNHVQALIMSEDVARGGVSPIIDWAATQARIRPFVSMVVTTDSAQMLMDVRTSLEPLTSNALLAIEDNFGRTMTAFEVPLLTFMRQLISPREDPAAPVFERIDPQLVKVPRGYLQQPISGQPTLPGALLGDVPNPGNELRTVGMAVFRGDKLVGILRGQAARGAVWLRGQPQGTVDVPHPEDPDQTASIVVVRSRTSVFPKLTGDTLDITVRIKLQGDAVELGTFQPFDYEHNLPALESETESDVSADVNEALRHLKTYESDMLGLRELLFRTDPRGWQRIKDHWSDVYRAATVHVVVDAHIDRSGLSR